VVTFKLLNAFVSSKKNVNISDFSSKTPLYYGSKAGKDTIVKFLLEKEAVINDEVLQDTYNNGHIKLVELLCKNIGNIDLQDDIGYTALHRFLNKGQLEVAKLLMANGSDPNITNVKGETALHRASYMDQLEVVKILMANGADPNIKNEKGETSLHKASYEGCLEVVEHLVDKEADPNIKDNNGKTAYDHTIERDIIESSFIKVANFLLPLTPNRADPNLKNEEGETALHRAARLGNLDVVKQLIANGTDPKLKDNNYRTAYDHAIVGSMGGRVSKNPAHTQARPALSLLMGGEHWSKEKYIKVMNYLLPYTLSIANPNLRNDKGETTLHLASFYGYLEVVNHLTTNGAEPTLKDNNGNTAYDHAMDINIKCNWSDKNVIEVLYFLYSLTPSNKKSETVLHQASYEGRLEVVKHLMANGADPNVINKKGETALHRASYGGVLKVVKYLIDNGADPELKDNNGKTAYDHAINVGEDKFIEVINLLLPLCPNKADPNLKNEKGETALHRASNQGYLEVVKHLLANGADANIKNEVGETALHIASYRGYLEVVKHLMANGADAKLTNKKGETTLHKASYGGELDVVKHVMANGADPKLKDNFGKTAYDHAINGRRTMEDQLIELINFLQPLCPNKADPNLKNEKGETALHTASNYGYLEVVKHLLANGADPELNDNDGKTAYDHAKEVIVSYGQWSVRWKNCAKVMNYLQRRKAAQEAHNNFDFPNFSDQESMEKFFDEESIKKFYLHTVQLGAELLATGDIENGVEYLFMAVSVSGQPDSLLGVLQGKLQSPVYALLLQNLDKAQKQARDHAALQGYEILPLNVTSRLVGFLLRYKRSLPK